MLNEPISNELVAAQLILDGSWKSASLNAAVNRNVLPLAKAKSISISQHLVQSAVDRFREENGLVDEHTTMEWLASFGLELSQLVDYCKIQLLKSALLASYSDEAIDTWFSDNKKSYDCARLSSFSFANEADAWLAHNEGSNIDLQELSWQRAQADSSIKHDGYGWKYRKTLAANAQELVFAAKPGTCTTPVLLGRYFYVYCVWQIKLAERRPDVDLEIRNDLLLNELTASSQ